MKINLHNVISILAIFSPTSPLSVVAFSDFDAFHTQCETFARHPFDRPAVRRDCCTQLSGPQVRTQKRSCGWRSEEDTPRSCLATHCNMQGRQNDVKRQVQIVFESSTCVAELLMMMHCLKHLDEISTVAIHETFNYI